jgi:hypothetical protein
VLVLLLAIKGFLVNRFKVVKIIGALVVDAFVDGKELAVLLGSKGMGTVRALEFYRLGDLFTGDESLATDFALILTIAAIVVI